MNYIPKRTAPEQILTVKKRVEAVKAYLPHNWRTRVVAQFDELNNKNGMQFLSNLLRLQTYDEVITDCLEKMAVEYFNELQAGLVNIGLLGGDTNHGTSHA